MSLPQYEFTIAPSCPWYEAQQTYGAPNINWCEPTRCALINEPANTWSNLPYMLVGLFIFYRLSRGTDKLMKQFGVAIFLMGLFSFVYHATNNFLTQFFDFIGMYLMTSMVVAVQLQRIKQTDNYYAFFWAALFFNTLLFWLFHLNAVAIQHTVAIQAVLIAVLEIYGRKTSRTKAGVKNFVLALVALGLAQACSFADMTRFYCEPENSFLHGHALWHLIGAVGMWFLAKHVQSLKAS